MILGLGTDIVENARIREALDRFGERFLDRIYHPEEREYCFSKKNPVPSLSARFAAKEAFVKALNLGPGEVVPYSHIYVSGRGAGKKHIRVTGQAERRLAGVDKLRIHLSISHGRDFSLATVILEDLGTGRAAT